MPVRVKCLVCLAEITVVHNRFLTCRAKKCKDEAWRRERKRWTEKQEKMKKEVGLDAITSVSHARNAANHASLFAHRKPT